MHAFGNLKCQFENSSFVPFPWKKFCTFQNHYFCVFPMSFILKRCTKTCASGGELKFGFCSRNNKVCGFRDVRTRERDRANFSSGGRGGAYSSFKKTTHQTPHPDAGSDDSPHNFCCIQFSHSTISAKKNFLYGSLLVPLTSSEKSAQRCHYAAPYSHALDQ